MDQACQNFCNVIGSAAKISIPRGCRNNHILHWDPECENVHRVFLPPSNGNNSSRAATGLLSRLDRKRRDRWSEGVQSIGFSHSSRKTSSILNNLTSRSRHSPVAAPSQMTPSHLSGLETGDMKLLMASRRDSYLKRYLTSGKATTSSSVGNS